MNTFDPLNRKDGEEILSEPVRAPETGRKTPIDIKSKQVIIRRVGRE